MPQHSLYMFRVQTTLPAPLLQVKPSDIHLHFALVYGTYRGARDLQTLRSAGPGNHGLRIYLCIMRQIYGLQQNSLTYITSFSFIRCLRDCFSLVIVSEDIQSWGAAASPHVPHASQQRSSGRRNVQAVKIQPLDIIIIIIATAR